MSSIPGCALDPPKGDPREIKRRVAKVCNQPSAVLYHEFDGCEVRVLILGGEPWLIAQEVLRILGMSGRGRCIPAVRYRLPVDRSGWAMARRPDGRGTQHMIVLAAGALDGWLTAEGHPSAAAFREWLAEAVLPSLPH